MARINRGIIMLFKPKVESLEKAYDLFHNKYWREEKKEKREFVLEKWNELILPKIEELIEKKDVAGFFKLTGSFYFPPSGKAVDLAKEASEKLILLISTSNQAQNIYNSSDSCGRDHGNKFSLFLEERWKYVSRLEITKAEDFASLKQISPFIHSSLYNWYFSILCHYCNSIEEVKELNSVAHKTLSCGHSDIYEIINKRIDAILFDQIPNISNIEEIQKYYRIAPSGSVTKMMAFEKWLELCKTPEQANEAYQSAPKDKIACSLQAYKKAVELANPLK